MNDNELFVGGDPRFLSGALQGARCGTYDRRPTTIKETDLGSLATTRGLGFDAMTSRGVRGALEAADIAVRTGRHGYHHRPSLNVFLREGEWPSAGIELETEERADVDCNVMMQELASNWFHFEHDGSLSTCGDDGIDREGYELITEPLPPRFYRNPRLWAGLQNVISPWLESWNYRETGLHVHVGLTQFEEAKELSFLHDVKSRRNFAKYLVAFTYLVLCEHSLADRIFLRKNTDYCGEANADDLLPEWRRGMTGADVLDETLDSVTGWMMRSMSHMTTGYMGQCGRLAETAARHTAETAAANVGMDGNGLVGTWSQSPMFDIYAGFSGHHVELNMGNPMTVEFRRGKGTVNGLSIHRMVEFTTLLVRYAMHMLKAPEEEVSPVQLYKYIIQNTTSGALKTLVEKHLKGE